MLRIWNVFIPDPGSRIPNPGSNNDKKEKGGKLVIVPFFEAINLTKFKNYFLFVEQVKTLCKQTNTWYLGYLSFFNTKNYYQALRRYELDPGSAVEPDSEPDPDPVGTRTFCLSGTGSTTLVTALGEQHGTVQYSINTGILISGIGASPEERTAGRQDELVSLHRVSITHLTKIKSLLKMVLNSVMDPDPVGSASFRRIGIGAFSACRPGSGSAS